MISPYSQGDLNYYDNMDRLNLLRDVIYDACLPNTAINKYAEKVPNNIPGGKGRGSNESDFNPAELVVGTVDETKDHTTNNYAIGEEIAADHLTEDPNYYKKMLKSKKFNSVKNEVGTQAKVHGYLNKLCKRIKNNKK